MSTGITVDIEPLCERQLQLFVDGHNAWGHLWDHALGVKEPGEEQGWGLLLPALLVELTAGCLDEIRDLARTTSVDSIPVRLEPIYREFLGCIQQAVERGVRLNWYWEEVPGTQCRWSVFGKEGILAHLDDDYVRTGYLPETNPDNWSDPSVGSPDYRLFRACLNRVKTKYRKASKRRLIEKIQADFAQLLRTNLDEASWNALL
jgi:hypothetical protein